MAIYIQIFPEDAAHMLKYMSTIKTIYEMKGNESFRYYDETFRLLRKENSQPWQQEIGAVSFCTTLIFVVDVACVIVICVK
jgi:hypothetical protein